MPGPFQSRVAAWFIAILGLGGLCAERAMAQSAPQLLLATLDPTDIVAKFAPQPKSSGLAFAIRASETRLPNYFGIFSTGAKPVPSQITRHICRTVIARRSAIQGPQRIYRNGPNRTG